MWKQYTFYQKYIGNKPLSLEKYAKLFGISTYDIQSNN